MSASFLWNVRRELWEHRSVWMAPAAVALLVVVAFGLGLAGGQVSGHFSRLPPDKQQMILAVPFGLTASVILLTAFVIGAFYSLDALNGERRDRSILFWKSMPVSDAQAVLSKAVVPLAIVPAIGFAIALATQVLVLALGYFILRAKGFDTSAALDKLPLLAMTASMLYGVAVHALWFAPLYALMLLLSVATRRPLLWLIIPVIAVQLVERLAFGTTHSGSFIHYRLLGAMREAFKPGASRDPVMSLTDLDPARFLGSPGLWLGLAAAVLFLFVAIRIRRKQEPLS